jgi:hypothetical protein
MADETQSQDPEDRSASVERQLDETKGSGSGQTSSPADEQPAQEGDLAAEAPESAQGVGESTTTSGQDVASGGGEAGRQDTGTRGESERPTGTSDERDTTGVNPQD